ncbi:MAG: M16 family metallopeptidase, partial [Acidobacteriota bacterium]
PAFEEDKIKIAKNQVVAGISRQNDNPQQILFREFNEILYGAESPYARNPTYETIGNIKHQDLTQWHATYFHPNNVILGLIGDLDTQEALRKVQNAFGDWQRGPAAVRGKIAYNRTVQPGVYYVEKNDMTQSNIIMGHFGIQRDNPDYFAVEVLNYVLSGSFASRLFLNVRSKKGLAYSVRGAVGSNWDYLGTLNMWMTTKTETTGAGIEALLEEARNLRARPPTEEEVDKAKAGILNSFIFRIDTGRKILGQQLTYEYYGYPSDWLSRYRAGIENANLEQVRQAAIKYVHPDRFAILVVGPSEGRDKPLSEFGDVTAVDITIPEPEAPQVEVTAAGQEKGAAVIARAVKAAGGAEMIDSLKSFRVEATSLAHTPQGEMEIKTSTLIQVPDRFRQELSLPFGKITVVLTPDAAFQLTPRGVAAIPDSRRKEAAKGMLRNPMMILRSRNNADFVPIFAGSEELDGEPVDVVRLEIGGDPTTVVVDADGHIVQLRYRGVGLSGAPGDLVWTFSDFRQVEGFSYPFASSATRNGNPMVSSTVNSVTVNQPVDEALFKKPESK